MHTLYPPNEASIEMGATWLGEKHRHLTALRSELNIPIYPQPKGSVTLFEYHPKLPPNKIPNPPESQPSQRIRGGSSALIQTLAQNIPLTTLKLGQIVTRLDFTHPKPIVQTLQASFQSDLIVSTLPPKLLSSSIEINPQLPDTITQIASQTHTWMAESIKVGLTYTYPFWNNSKTSGTLLSHVGPIFEMYDHSLPAQNLFALKAFVHESLSSIPQAQRKKLILQQLTRLYGVQAQEYVGYHECIWQNEPYTYLPYDTHIAPHQNNGHPHFRIPYQNGHLLLSGSETAEDFPGYMDGAVQSAIHTANYILEHYSHS